MPKLPLCLPALLLAIAASAQTPDSRLPVGDAERATGVRPLHLVAPGSQPGAGPGLDFAKADNTLVLMVNFGPESFYTRAKTQKEFDVGGTKVPMVLFHAAVPGIGDEAFDSPPGSVQYIIYLRKGTSAASVSTYLDRDGTPRLSIETLKAVARLVAGRL